MKTRYSKAELQSLPDKYSLSESMFIHVKKSNKIALIVLAITVLIIATLSINFYFDVPDPYSPKSVSALIAKYNSSRSEATLLEYIHQMEKRNDHRELGEPTRASLPDELETYLLNLLSRGTPNDRRNIVKFYINVPRLTSCCWKIATYGDTALIGDFLQQAKQLNDEAKLSSLKLVENLRRDRALYKPDLRGGDGVESSTINSVFKLYENWWASPLNLHDKLEVDPLKSSTYRWSELE